MTLEIAPTPATVPVLVDEHGRTPRGLWGITTTFFRRQPVGAIGLVLVLIFGLAGIFAEWLAPYSPTSNDFAAMTEPPSWAHWLGTDQLGRDLFSRILYGARTASIVGLTSSVTGGLSALVIGVGPGALLSRSWGAGAGAGLGADAAGRRRGIRLDSAVDRGLPRPRDHADGVRHQFVRRRLARRPRPEVARPLIASSRLVPARAGPKEGADPLSRPLLGNRELRNNPGGALPQDASAGRDRTYLLQLLS